VYQQCKAKVNHPEWPVPTPEQAICDRLDLLQTVRQTQAWSCYEQVVNQG